MPELSWGAVQHEKLSETLASPGMDLPSLVVFTGLKVVVSAGGIDSFAQRCPSFVEPSVGFVPYWVS